jgi:TPR repeat protein
MGFFPVDGVFSAIFNYGYCLENGFGLARDLIRAAEYYKPSADQGMTSERSEFRSVPGRWDRYCGAYRDGPLTGETVCRSGNLQGQYSSADSLEPGKVVPRDLCLSARYYRVSHTRCSNEESTE